MKGDVATFRVPSLWCIPVVVPWLYCKRIKEIAPGILRQIEKKKKQQDVQYLGHLEFRKQLLHGENHQGNGSIDKKHPGAGGHYSISFHAP